MATYNTNNPLGSADPRDLLDNSQIADHFVSDTENESWPDRFGNVRKTWQGIENASNRAMLAYGYVTKKSFALGNTISNPNEVLYSESDGEYYRWDGSLPKAVPAGSTPESAGGVGSGKWLSVGDAVLRSDIAATIKRNQFSLFDFAPLNTPESEDWGPYIRAAIAAADAAGGGIVNFSGNLTVSSLDTVGWVSPFDDGTIDPRRTSDSSLSAEQQTTFGVHINLPSGVSLVGRDPNMDSLTFTWDGETIDEHQPVGICKRVTGWDGSYIAANGAKNRMMTVVTNSNIGGFSMNNCFMPIVSDGIEVYANWGDLYFNNCGIPMAILGFEAGEIGSLKFSGCLTGLVAGGWWLQRNDVSFQAGEYLPPYSGADAYSLGWIDSLKVREILGLFDSVGSAGVSDKYLAIDKFFDKFFWKTANSTLKTSKTPTGDTGLGRLSIYGSSLTSGTSTLQSDNPFRGIGGRAVTLASRYNRGNSNNELVTIKSVNTPRGPIWLNPAGGPNGLNTISHNAYIENSGLISSSGSRVAGSSNDWFASGKDIWNADIKSMPYYAGQGVLTTVFASPTNCIICPASNSNQGGSSLRINTMTGALTAGEMVESTTMYNPATGEWRQISARFVDHDYTRGLSFSGDENYTSYFVAAEKSLDTSGVKIFNCDNADNFTDVSATVNRAIMRRTGNDVKLTLSFSLSSAAVANTGKMAIGIPRYGIYDSSLSDGQGKYPAVNILHGGFSSSGVFPQTALHRGYFNADGSAGGNGYHIIQLYSDFNQNSPVMLSGISSGADIVLEITYESYNSIDSISLI